MFPTNPTIPTDTSDNTNASLVEDRIGEKMYTLLVSPVPLAFTGELVAGRLADRFIPVYASGLSDTI